ncbi:hypothetical protein LR066_01710 [candidate division WOR-3 bacterium]|nr:hypothetical protein [candidate division WOR-3 bacterium]
MKREDIIEAIKNISREDVYLVGGSLRDELLGMESNDIDLMVRGDAREVAICLSERFGVKIEKESQFGTFLLSISSLRIDIAIVRKEKYEKPASLPKVEPGFLLDDLARRDFTINSIASPLGTGLLIDPFAGEKDIRKGLIRVLHGRSFIDDPTRIFRAIKLAERLDFRIETITESLMKEAIEKESLSLLSYQRIRNELSLCFKEKNRWKITDRLADLGIFDQIGLSYHGKKLFEELDEFAAEIEISPEPLYFMALVDDENRDILTKAERGYLKTTKELEKKIPKLKMSQKLREMDTILEGFPDYPLVYIGVRKGVKEKVCSYLKKIRTVRLELTGEDIKKLGVMEGKLVGEILRKIKIKKLEGEIKGKKEEIEYVQKIVNLRSNF